MRSKNATFECHHCGFCVNRKDSITRHIKTCHLGSGKNRKTSIECGICQQRFVLSAHLQNHMNIEHEPIVKSSLTFVSEEDFRKWKEEEEIRSKSFFCKKRSSKRDKKKYVTFICNRSGKRKNNLNPRKRRFLSKGYSKIGSYCPAQISAIFHDNGVVEATYCSTHIGHLNDVCFLHLPLSQEKIIAEKIKDGVSLNSILDEIRNNGQPASLEETHLNKKKLYSIMRKYNISGKYSQSDLDILVEECSELDLDPFIVLEKQNDCFPDPVPISTVEIKVDSLLADDKICNILTIIDDNIRTLDTSIFRNKLQRLAKMWENIDPESMTEEKEKKLSRYIDKCINILCQENCDNLNEEPEKIKSDPRVRFSPTRKIKEENENWALKTATMVQEEILEEIIIDANTSVINLRADFDHSYY